MNRLSLRNAVVRAVGVDAVAWKPKILSILALVIFVFVGCVGYEEEEEEEVIPTLFFTHQSSSSQTGVVYGENIVVLVGGSGSLVLSGTCNFAEITVRGSGGFSGSNLEIRSAEVNSSGSGHSFVWVTDRLHVTIQGSGNVYYKGSPRLSSTIQGSGKLIKM